MAVHSLENYFRDKNILFLGGSSGIGLAAAKIVSSYGANIFVVGRNQDRLDRVLVEIPGSRGKQLDVTKTQQVKSFFDEIGSFDHLLATHGGPLYVKLSRLDFDAVQQNFHDRFVSMLAIAKFGVEKVREGGSMVFMGGTTSRRPGPGYAVTGPLNDAVETLTKNLAVELAPVRINLIAAGFVDTPLSQRILGESFQSRAAHLRSTLPIRRVVTAEDVAMTAVQLMASTAITGSIIDLDGGQHLIA